MPRINLMPYYVHVKARTQEDFLVLGQLPGGQGLSALLNQYLANRSIHAMHDNQSQRLLSVLHTTIGSDATSGRLRSGFYGFESDLVDVDSGVLTYQRRPVDAEMMPFYFRAFLPDHSNTGILLLEKFGLYSVKSALTDDFRDYLRAMVPYGNDLSLLVDPLIPADTARKWIEKGEILKVRLVRRSAPSDLADEVANRRLTMPEIGEAELTWKVRRGKRMSRKWNALFLRFMDGATTIGDTFSLPTFEPETIRIELEIEGKTRTVDLVNSTKLRAWYDVSEQVAIGEDGHPIFDSIDAVARGIVEDLLQD